MMPTQQPNQGHSVAEYMRRLSTKELFYLLRCYIHSEHVSAMDAEEILSILESRFDATQQEKPQAR